MDAKWLTLDKDLKFCDTREPLTVASYMVTGADPGFSKEGC